MQQQCIHIRNSYHLYRVLLIPLKKHAWNWLLHRLIEIRLIEGLLPGENGFFEGVWYYYDLLLDITPNMPTLSSKFFYLQKLFLGIQKLRFSIQKHNRQKIIPWWNRKIVDSWLRDFQFLLEFSCEQIENREVSHVVAADELRFEFRYIEGGNLEFLVVLGGFVKDEVVDFAVYDRFGDINYSWQPSITPVIPNH